MFTPTDIANKALLAMGEDIVLGDIEDGTKPAQALLLAYRDCVRALLRGAPWQFARRQVPLQLLADASGQTPSVGVLVPAPWLYEYAYPIDCLHLRFVPWSPSFPSPPIGNIAQPTGVPNIQALGSGPVGHMQLRPTRFLVANDPNYPPEPGSQWWTTEGVSPAGRKVILSNVKCAEAVYTSMVEYPNVWDALFYDAMVARLAAETVLTIKKKDPKGAREVRRDQIAIAKEKLTMARVADGNEMWANTDHMPDWMQARGYGGSWGRSGVMGDVLGGSYSGWLPVSFGDGGAY